MKSFDLDANGILKVTAVDTATGKANQIIIRFAFLKTMLTGAKQSQRKIVRITNQEDD
jgi:molecular chaperone DnaK (HSP70)